MAKKIVEEEHGLKDVAVTVGAALGKLAHMIGLGETSALGAPKPAKKKIVGSKSPALKKKVAVKKGAAKRTSVKKAKGPVK
jgi:hypothetical protein